jgi:hypothetical protein
MALHGGNDLVVSELICAFRQVFIMPVIRYLIFAAGLLALLFLTDAYLPHAPLQSSATASKPVIRIASHRKALPPVVIESTWSGSLAETK